MGISRGTLNAIFGGAAGAGQWAGQRRMQNIERDRFQAEDAWRRDEPVRQAAMLQKQADIGEYTRTRERNAERERQDAENSETRKLFAQHWPQAVGGDAAAQAALVARVPGLADRFTTAPRVAATPNIDPLSTAGIAAAAQRAAAVAQAEAPFKTTAQPKSRALPSSAVEKLVGIDNMLTMATDVRDALQNAVRDGSDVTGRVGGVIPTPGWVKNLTGKGGAEGTDTRALIGNLYGTVAKERGGTALSAPEIRLLESYIPSENEDETTATIKANRFIRTLRSMRANKLKAYQQFGFGVDDEAPMADQPQYMPDNPYVRRP